MLNPSLNSKLKSQSPSNQTLSAMLNVLEGLTYHSVSDTHSLSTEKNSTPKFALRNYPHSPEQIAQALMVDNKGNLRRTSRGLSSKPIGTLYNNRYLKIKFNNHYYSNHVICFCLYYGKWPEEGKVIDHINGIGFDNRKENLREVTNSQNMQNTTVIPLNNTSGHRNIFWSKIHSLWVFNKVISGIRLCKYFKSIDEAIYYRDSIIARYKSTNLSI